MRLIRKLFFLLFLVLLAFVFAAIGYYFAVTRGTSLQPEKLAFTEKHIQIFDCNGEELQGVAAQSAGETVRFSEIPNHTVRAFTDTEDKRFFQHNGFDVKRIVKAFFSNLRARSFKQGASTISQQLVKNTHLTQEKTIKRKLREWKLTRALERQYTKEEILEKYLNVIYFGHNCFGLRAAADFYFGKQPQELTLADSAILAGLVKSPNNYSPFKNPEKCARRKETVLNCMLKNESITPAQKASALEEALPTYENKTKHGYSYAHFVFDELSTIAEEHDFTVGGNLKIYTALDKNLQKELENTTAQYTQSDFSAAILDNATRAVKAYVSTVGDIQRSPGSLIKPLAVYAPALETGFISPATPILDDAVRYGEYAPNNHDGKFHGYVSARECLSQSLNVPAVKIMESVGAKTCAKYLNKLRLPVADEDVSLALALGGMKKGYSLLELLRAYACFPNAGEYAECGFITEIRNGDYTVYKKSTKKERVFSEETAYLLTDILQTAAQSGTAKKLRSLPFPIAAKTGTVGTENGNTDAYALSYTTKCVVGVWLGNADNSLFSHTGGGLPCNLLYEINRAASKNAPPTAFPKPNGVKRVSLDKYTYYDRHTLLLADENAPMDGCFEELFKTDFIPTQKCDIYTFPSIIPPVLSTENGNVILSFSKNTPSFYTLKIERDNYVTHTTLYEGAYLPRFTDTAVVENETYVYRVTPFYKGAQGETVTLPSIRINETPRQPEIGIPKEWWR